MPKITEEYTLLSAYEWRSILSKDSNQVIVMTNSESAAVETMNEEELKPI